MTGILDLDVHGGAKTVGPQARKKLSGLIKYYMKKKHPFAACVRDNTKRFGKDGAERVCATLKDIGTGTTKWRKGGKKSHAEIEEAMISELWAACGGNVDGLVEYTLECAIADDTVQDAIAELQVAKPQLTTVPDVPILKTGIEYPLSTGPTTFTPEDLAAAVAAQSDPGVPQPRIWIGHPDDERIHGQRRFGPPSGEPALGKVTDMRLTEDGHCVVGDLTGVPIWLANIMASAFPSRSIEGRFNVKTPTGKSHRLIINGLALLGVVWPGVMTIEDIASLYTEKGPEGVTVETATPELPVVIAGYGERAISAQVTVEDLRRIWYESIKGDPDKYNWWLRAIYIEPNELIVDADDGGTLLRQPFTIKGDKVKFGKAKKVKIKYVNASNGGVEAETVNSERQHVALFDSRFEGEPGLQVDVRAAGVIEVKFNRKGSQ